MDYEKKYKELVEKLTKAYNDEGVNAESFCCVMNEIMPELAEGDDERIRRHIIEIFDNLAPCHFDGNEKGECIAWLEKQKGTKRENEGNSLLQRKRKSVIMPKFRVGDIVRDIEDNETLTIKAITKDKYIYTNGEFDRIKDQDVLELVEQKPSNDNSTAVHNYLISLANAGKFSIPEIVETLRIMSTCLNAEYLNNGKR